MTRSVAHQIKADLSPDRVALNNRLEHFHLLRTIPIWQDKERLEPRAPPKRVQLLGYYAVMLNTDLTANELTLARDSFEALPLLVEGESKIVRLLSQGKVAVRLKPTLFSYKANRGDVVPGTESLRLRISELLWKSLHEVGVDTTIVHVDTDFYISELIDPPPIEVIVKAAHVGTPKHIYHNMSSFPTRDGGRVLDGERHEPYVRFDWRNPLPGRDECMPIGLANKFIDCEVASRTALVAFEALKNRLSHCGIEILDICFFITADGKKVFGELSPDCMRAKRTEVDLDKDLWRQGRDAETILARWSEFLNLLRLTENDR